MTRTRTKTSAKTRTKTSTASGPGTLRMVHRVFGGGLVAVAAAWAVTIVPWLRGPAEPRGEIDAGWAALAELAAPARAGGSADLLRDALGAMERSSYGRLDTIGAPVDDAARRAVELLVAWDQRGGGVGLGPCVDASLPAFAFLMLASAALESVEGPDDPRLIATIHLGERLRDRGRAMGGMIGQRITQAALARIDRKGWPRPAEIVEGGPSDREVRAILAREIVCTEAALPEWLASGRVSPRQFSEGRLEGFIADYAFDVEREQLHLRAFGARVVDTLAAGSIEAIAAALRAPPRDEAPASLMVRGLEKLDLLAGMLGDGVTLHKMELATRGR